MLVSNVAGNVVANRLIEWVHETWELRIELAFVSPKACGVENGYDDPGQLGIDRWLALIATWNKYKASACVVDCGTAVTIDGLSTEGRHTGGLILPGISLMQRCLSTNTAALEQPHSGQITPMARNTRDAIWTGCVYAVAACIDRIATGLEDAYGACQTVITGGHAKLVVTQLRHQSELVPNLVLDGLAVWGETHQ
jgi:type III pantothenate kinase